MPTSGPKFQPLRREDVIQGWPKIWSRGCVILYRCSVHKFTQPMDHLFGHPCVISARLGKGDQYEISCSFIVKWRSFMKKVGGYNPRGDFELWLGVFWASISDSSHIFTDSEPPLTRFSMWYKMSSNNQGPILSPPLLFISPFLSPSFCQVQWGSVDWSWLWKCYHF